MVESTALTNLKQAIRYPGDGESDASTTNKLRHELLATTADRADVKVALQFAEDMRLTAVRQAEAYATSMTARPDTNWSPQNNMYSQAYVDGADDLMLRDMILAVVWTELKASGRGTLVTGEFSGCSNGPPVETGTRGPPAWEKALSQGEDGQKSNEVDKSDSRSPSQYEFTELEQRQCSGQ